MYARDRNLVLRYLHGEPNVTSQRFYRDRNFALRNFHEEQANDQNSQNINNDDKTTTPLLILFIIISIGSLILNCVFAMYAINRMTNLENQVGSLRFTVKEMQVLGETLLMSPLFDHLEDVSSICCLILIIVDVL